jgi:phospholipid transport system substrate-binding protein
LIVVYYDPSVILRLCNTTGAILIALALMQPLHALAAPDPMAETKTAINQVVALLKDRSLESNPAARRQRLDDTVNAHFDFAMMARSALGVHWSDLSEKQRKDFVELFTHLFQVSYIRRVESYFVQPIVFVKESIEGTDYAQVDTNILNPAGQDPTSLDYRLKLENGRWLVYDVVVDNISMVTNYRNQFARVLDNANVDFLMNHMRSKRKDLDAGHVE